LTDINGPLMGGAKIIQLWHGMALRKIGFGGDWQNNDFKGKMQNFVSKWFPYAYYMKCDVLYAPSQIAKENFVEPFSKSFRNNKIEENIILVRQPRTLCFEENFQLSNEFFSEKNLLLSFEEKYDKVISWLPTQRRQLGKTIIDVISDSELNLNKFNEFCKSKNILFVIKPHFLDFDEASKIVENLDFIYIYPHADPYPLLKYTDILITDYSSVFYDFLFLNRPILFMAYDLEEYVKKVQFYYNYENLNIGPICKSWKEIKDVILKNIDGIDTFIETRNNTFEKYNFIKKHDLKVSI
jgi:CDP-glycerol glycerophosphotransferase (TagB/SpsB family)